MIANIQGLGLHQDLKAHRHGIGSTCSSAGFVSFLFNSAIAKGKAMKGNRGKAYRCACSPYRGTLVSKIEVLHFYCWFCMQTICVILYTVCSSNYTQPLPLPKYTRSRRESIIGIDVRGKQKQLFQPRHKTSPIMVTTPLDKIKMTVFNRESWKRASASVRTEIFGWQIFCNLLLNYVCFIID